jgi:hypothetical protein
MAPTAKLTVLGNLTLARFPGDTLSPGHELSLESGSLNVTTVHEGWEEATNESDTCDGNRDEKYKCKVGEGGKRCLDVVNGTFRKKSNVYCKALTDKYSLRTYAGTLEFLNTAGEVKMVIGQDGYVGIGTTTPSQKLTVEGNIKAANIIADNYLVGKLAYTGEIQLDAWNPSDCTSLNISPDEGFCFLTGVILDLTYQPDYRECSLTIKKNKWTLCGYDAIEGGIHVKCQARCIRFKGTEGMLFGMMHSETGCRDLGGTVVEDNDGKFCRFQGNACPSGWQVYKTWSTTEASTCTPPPGTSGYSCTTKYHQWSNTAPEFCIYKVCYQTIGIYPPYICEKVPCYAKVREIGCY